MALLQQRHRGVREHRAWQGVPVLLFADKLDMTDPDQWSLLEVV